MLHFLKMKITLLIAMVYTKIKIVIKERTYLIIMKINTTFSGNKVPRTTKILYPLCGVGRDMLYTLFSLFLLVYITYTMTGDATSSYEHKMLAITIILVVYRIWDGINDPMIGALIENTNMKMGKYKPWILYGAIGSAISTVLLFSISFDGWWYIVFFGVVYLVWEITFTMNDIAYWSMLPSLTSDAVERVKLSTAVTVAASVGAFIAGGVIPLIYPGRAKAAFMWMSIGISAIYLLMQLVIVFFTQEKERPKEVVEKEQMKLKEMFKIAFKNKQLMVMLGVILLYYTGSALLNAVGLNFFIFSFGYEVGNQYMFFFTVVYALGTIIAQALFPLIERRMSWEKLINLTFVVMIAGYVVFFVVGLIPIIQQNRATVVYLIIYLISAVFIFSSQGLFYSALLIFIANTIEYNEWKTGVRSESVVFAARPFAAKLSSSIQLLVTYVILLGGGVYGVTQKISSMERDAGLGRLTDAQVIEGADAAIFGSASLYSGQLAMLIGMTVIPIILYIGAYVLLKRKFKINKPAYERMVKDIEVGKVGPEYGNEL